MTNSIPVQQHPLAIHQVDVAGAVINQANKVLIATRPRRPHDMMCGILLPPKPWRLSERPFGRTPAEEAKRALSEAKVDAAERPGASSDCSAKVTFQATADFLLHSGSNARVVIKLR